MLSSGCPLPPLFCYFQTKGNMVISYQGMFTERFREGGLKSKASRARVCLLPSRFPIGSSVLLSKVKQTQDVKRANRKEKSTKISSCFCPPTWVVLSSRAFFFKKEKISPSSLNQAYAPSRICCLVPSLLMSSVINRSLSLSPSLHPGLSTFPQVNV